MSVIHYKFRSSKDTDTVTFDGLCISLADLKNAILTKKNFSKLDKDKFDLQVCNAQTQTPYKNEDLIPKNTSVIVARVPLERPVRRAGPKTWAPTRPELAISAVSTRPVPDNSVVAKPSHKPTELFNMTGTEDEKIEIMKKQATNPYDPANFVQKQPQHKPAGPVPTGYVCKICQKPGHWLYNCPHKNDPTYSNPTPFKRVPPSTGIPSMMMTPVDDPNTPGALRTRHGTYAVPNVNAIAYKEGKKEKPPFVKSESPEPVDDENKIPDELVCLICRDLMRDAVVIPCCGNCCCDECLRQKLLDSDDRACPICFETGQSPDNLVANMFMRKTCNDYRNDGSYNPSRSKASAAATTKPPPVAAVKVEVTEAGGKNEARGEESPHRGGAVVSSAVAALGAFGASTSGGAHHNQVQYRRGSDVFHGGSQDPHHPPGSLPPPPGHLLLAPPRFHDDRKPDIGGGMDAGQSRSAPNISMQASGGLAPPDVRMVFLPVDQNGMIVRHMLPGALGGLPPPQGGPGGLGLPVRHWPPGQLPPRGMIVSRVQRPPPEVLRHAAPLPDQPPYHILDPLRFPPPPHLASHGPPLLLSLPPGASQAPLQSAPGMELRGPLAPMQPQGSGGSTGQMHMLRGTIGGPPPGYRGPSQPVDAMPGLLPREVMMHNPPPGFTPLPAAVGGAPPPGLPVDGGAPRSFVPLTEEQFYMEQKRLHDVMTRQQKQPDDAAPSRAPRSDPMDDFERKLNQPRPAPKPRSRSPYRSPFGAGSPRRDAFSPRRGIASPRRDAFSPRRGSMSPRRGNMSPRRGSVSPRRVAGSPPRRGSRNRSPSRSPYRRGSPPPYARGSPPYNGAGGQGVRRRSQRSWTRSRSRPRSALPPLARSPQGRRSRSLSRPPSRRSLSRPRAIAPARPRSNSRPPSRARSGSRSRSRSRPPIRRDLSRSRSRSRPPIRGLRSRSLSRPMGLTGMRSRSRSRSPIPQNSRPIRMRSTTRSRPGQDLRPTLRSKSRSRSIGASKSGVMSQAVGSAARSLSRPRPAAKGSPSRPRPPGKGSPLRTHQPAARESSSRARQPLRSLSRSPPPPPTRRISPPRQSRSPVRRRSSRSFSPALAPSKHHHHADPKHHRHHTHRASRSRSRGHRRGGGVTSQKPLPRRSVSPVSRKRRRSRSPPSQMHRGGGGSPVRGGEGKGRGPIREWLPRDWSPPGGAGYREGGRHHLRGGRSSPNAFRPSTYNEFYRSDGRAEHRPMQGPPPLRGVESPLDPHMDPHMDPQQMDSRALANYRKFYHEWIDHYLGTPGGSPVTGRHLDRRSGSPRRQYSRSPRHYDHRHSPPSGSRKGKLSHNGSDGKKLGGGSSGSRAEPKSAPDVRGHKSLQGDLYTTKDGRDMGRPMGTYDEAKAKGSDNKRSKAIDEKRLREIDDKRSKEIEDKRSKEIDNRSNEIDDKRSKGIDDRFGIKMDGRKEDRIEERYAGEKEKRAEEKRAEVRGSDDSGRRSQPSSKDVLTSSSSRLLHEAKPVKHSPSRSSKQATKLESHVAEKIAAVRTTDKTERAAVPMSDCASAADKKRRAHNHPEEEGKAKRPKLEKKLSKSDAEKDASQSKNPIVEISLPVLAPLSNDTGKNTPLTSKHKSSSGRATKEASKDETAAKEQVQSNQPMSDTRTVKKSRAVVVKEDAGERDSCGSRHSSPKETVLVAALPEISKWERESDEEVRASERKVKEKKEKKHREKDKALSKSVIESAEKALKHKVQLAPHVADPPVASIALLSSVVKPVSSAMSAGLKSPPPLSSVRRVSVEEGSLGVKDSTSASKSERHCSRRVVVEETALVVGKDLSENDTTPSGEKTKEKHLDGEKKSKHSKHHHSTLSTGKDEKQSSHRDKEEADKNSLEKVEKDSVAAAPRTESLKVVVTEEALVAARRHSSASGSQRKVSIIDEDKFEPDYDEGSGSEAEHSGAAPEKTGRRRHSSAARNSDTDNVEGKSKHSKKKKKKNKKAKKAKKSKVEEDD